MRFPSAFMIMLLAPISASAHGGPHAALSALEIFTHLLSWHAAGVSVAVLVIALWQGSALRRQSQSQPARQPHLADEQRRKESQ